MTAKETPQERWRPVSVTASSLPWPKRLSAVLAELGPGINPRYRAGPRETWCNVFVTDVVAAMGIRAPRHWMTSAGIPAAIGRGREMRANELVGWFRTHGPTWGWMTTDRETAEKAAARGHLAVVGWRNPKGGPGHVAILLGPDSIAQAGRQSFVRGRVSQGFGAAEPLEWWVQMERGGSEPHNKGAN